MIEMQIGDIKKIIKDASPSWIYEQLARRRRNGAPVCVQVLFDKPQVQMRLITPNCPRTSGRRTATPQEQELSNMWEERKLNDPNFTGGNLIAFLRQIS